MVWVTTLRPSVLVDVLVWVPFAYRDHGPVLGALDEVATEVLRHPSDRLSPDFPFELTDAPLGEVPYNTPVAVKLLVSERHQPVEYQGWDSALLLSSSCVICDTGMHNFFHTATVRG
jgi:hypothetical protein